MANVVIMPKQGQSVESCIVSEFKVKVGDSVNVGDILFGYETDKATFEEESKFDGTVLAIFWNDGDEKYYPLGVDDPDYCVIEFLADSGRYYRFDGKGALTADEIAACDCGRTYENGYNNAHPAKGA